jgi:ATP/maltotriose-dependent transcriptional regulator MalT
VGIGTRTQPQVSLPRRRVRGEVAELGLDDLSLDGPAIRHVLGAEVSDELVEEVTAASGGWAAAVRLAAERLAADPGAVGAGASSSALARLQPDLWRFLAEEVLERQPDEMRRFLLETALLDELSPPVCAAVTGREDSAALLAELDRQHLFLAHFANGGGEAWRSTTCSPRFFATSSVSSVPRTGSPNRTGVAARHWREDIVLAVMAAIEREVAAGPDYPAAPPV